MLNEKIEEKKRKEFEKNEKYRNIVYRLPINVKKALVKEISRLCEKQYRKGLQQGVGFHKEGYLTEENAADFRFDGSCQGYKKAVNPLYYSKKANPDKARKKVTWKGASRYSCELQNQPILHSLFNSVGY
tara:strand:- start:585 stop:974 length:390 start_codon:yes stop_codon:yes gene_type:complete